MGFDEPACGHVKGREGQHRGRDSLVSSSYKSSSLDMQKAEMDPMDRKLRQGDFKPSGKGSTWFLPKNSHFLLLFLRKGVKM